MQKSSDLTKKLAAYSAAATIAVGAGVGHAAGVLRDIPDTTINGGETLDIDFDNDGNPEFRVRVFSDTSSGTYAVYFDALSNGGDVGLSFLGSTGGAGSFGYPYRLTTGNPINSTNTTWAAFANQNSLNYNSSYGNFIGLRGYVGVRFNLDGAGPFYGWIELETTSSTQAIVYRYYYDDAGAGLFAGQTPTAVTMSDVATTTASNPVGIMALLTGALTALSGIGLWVRRRFLGER